MSKIGIVVPAIAIAVLAACASEQPATPAPAPQVIVVPQQQPAPVVQAPSSPAMVVAQPVSVKPGIGRVETMSAVPTTSAGSGTSTASDMRRLGVRMDDGTYQYVDTAAGNIRIGDRVQFTSEGYIRHPVP
jgi:hypothetical protein